MSPTTDPSKWSLQEQCEFIAKVYGLLGGAITTVTYAQQGEDTIVEWREAVLHNHQKEYFLQGLEKLGVDAQKEQKCPADVSKAAVDPVQGTVDFVDQSGQENRRGGCRRWCSQLAPPIGRAKKLEMRRQIIESRI